jgi:hypothetical protein
MDDEAKRERDREYARTYYAKNKRAIVAAGKRWKAANRDKVAGYAKTWRERNPEKALAIKLAARERAKAKAVIMRAERAVLRTRAFEQRVALRARKTTVKARISVPGFVAMTRAKDIAERMGELDPLWTRDAAALSALYAEAGERRQRVAYIVLPGDGGKFTLANLRLRVPRNAPLTVRRRRSPEISG